MADHSSGVAGDGKIILELADHSLHQAEATLIRRALREAGWNLKRAAIILDIARGSLYSKMKKYRIERPDR